MSFLVPILRAIDIVLALYFWVILIGVILSWLTAFNVVNPRNQAVRMIGNTTYQLTEPVLRRIRRIVPPAGNLDLSPFILGLVIFVIREYLHNFF